MSNKIIKTDYELEAAWDKVVAELQKAAEDPSHPFRNTVLSTVDLSSGPVSRTVVLRDLVDDEHILIYTDYRSDKVVQIENNDKVSMLFYDEEKKLQLRVKGHGEVHKNDQIVRDHKKYITRRSASSYTTARPPGKGITAPAEGWEYNERNLNNFCVIGIKISEMEFLQLNRNEHLRARRIFKDQTQEDSWLVP